MNTRPAFHFTARAGWINDPHGIVHRDGGYDVFYQYVPGSTVWGPNCHWGHARGADLLSLQECPVAIAPGDGDDGIWTGCVVVDDDGLAQIFYTATSTPDFGIGRIRVASPADDQWTAWTKGEVVASAPTSLDLTTFRDPFVCREGSRWRMVVGAGSSDGTARALSYVADEATGPWRYDGEALSRSTRETEPVWTGALWECPQLFAIGDRHALVFSVWDADELHHVAYVLGDYADGRFTAETWGRLTHGPSYYAPSLFHDSEGRACLTFWMRGISDPVAGWAGAHSIPHLLHLTGDRLVALPHPDIERYRSPGAAAAPASGLDIAWVPSPGASLEITRGERPVATLSATDAGTVIKVDDSTWTLPPSELARIVVDGPVLEVATPSGNFGGAIPTPSGALSLTWTGPAPEVHALERPDDQPASPTKE